MSGSGWFDPYGDGANRANGIVPSTSASGVRVTPSSRVGLFGGQHADMMANIARSRLAEHLFGRPADLSGDGTGLRPSVTIAPYLPRLAGQDASLQQVFGLTDSGSRLLSSAGAPPQFPDAPFDGSLVYRPDGPSVPMPLPLPIGNGQGNAIQLSAKAPASDSQDMSLSASATNSRRAADTSDAGNPNTVMQYDLPGVGTAYFDPEFAKKPDDFRARAKADNIPLSFSAGYRTQTYQDGLKNNPTAITPAKHSLHSTGDAVDVPSMLKLDPATRDKLVADANAAGLTWGGTFKKPRPDPVHFQYNPVPGQDIVKRVNAFAQDIAAFQRKYPKQ